MGPGLRRPTSVRAYSPEGNWRSAAAALAPLGGRYDGRGGGVVGGGSCQLESSPGATRGQTRHTALRTLCPGGHSWIVWRAGRPGKLQSRPSPPGQSRILPIVQGFSELLGDGLGQIQGGLGAQKARKNELDDPYSHGQQQRDDQGPNCGGIPGPRGNLAEHVLLDLKVGESPV